MKKITILCFAICLIFAPASMAQKKAAAKPFTTSGYFNEIVVVKSGEASGMAVFLTESDGQLYALVMQAAEDYLQPILVEAKVSGKDMRTIEFTMPENNPYGVVTYKGVVSANALNLSDKTGKRTLKRECRYLYSNLSVGKGGDYGGMEVFFFDKAGSALVTVAEGVLQRPVLVEASITGGKTPADDVIEFTLPGEGGAQRKFTGKFTKTGLMLKEAGTTINLKSKCYK